MRIIRLTIDNFRTIEAAELNPDASPKVIKGKNGAGKSALLGAIEFALGDAPPGESLRKGAEKCVVRLHVGEKDEVAYVIRRSRTKKGNEALQIDGPDGAQVKEPAKFLSDLVGGRKLLDPMEFQRMKPTERAEMARLICGLDFSKIDADRAKAYDERTVVNRFQKQAQATLDGTARPTADTQDEEISTSELLEQVTGLGKQRLDHLKTLEGVQLAQGAHKQATDRVAELQRQLEEARGQMRTCASALQRAEETAEAAGASAAAIEVINAEINEITAKAKDVEGINAAVRTKKLVKERQAEVQKQTRESNRLTQVIDKFDAEKEKLIADAKMPVEGMRFTEGDVFVGDLPFDNLSTGQQYRVSAALAMSKHPELRVMLIREAALIEKANLDAIYELARERDYDVWLEFFAEQPDGQGLWIEDGNIYEAKEAAA